MQAANGSGFLPDSEAASVITDATVVAFLEVIRITSGDLSELAKKLAGEKQDSVAMSVELTCMPLPFFELACMST